MNIGAFSYSANSSGRKSSIYRGTVHTIPQLFIWHMERQQHKKIILCMYSKTYCMVIFRLFLNNAIRKKLRKGVFICTEYWN